MLMTSITCISLLSWIPGYADIGNNSQTYEDLSTQSKQRELSLSSANELFHHAGDPILGNPHGKVTLVEFLDYQCSHCIAMDKGIQALIQANPNLRVVIKEFPIFNSFSFYAAQAALSANQQGKFALFHHGLVNLAGDINHDTLTSLAQRVGLNLAQFNSELDSSAVAAQISSNRSLGQELQLTGTPAFFIGSTYYPQQNNTVLVHFIYGQVNSRYLQSSINHF